MTRAFLGTYFSRLACRLAPHPIGRLPPIDSSGTNSSSQTALKSLHLSFDDGPTDEGTPLLLDVLARYDVKASFFLIGENAHQQPDRVREIAAAGHQIGNHSWSHINAWSSSLRDTIRDFTRCRAELESIVSAGVTWVRPPFGYLTKPLVRWCKRHSQQMVLWDTMPPDFTPGKSPEDITRAFRRRLRDRSIVCLHDNSTSRWVTPKSLDQLLPELIDSGWKFRMLGDN